MNEKLIPHHFQQIIMELSDLDEEDRIANLKYNGQYNALKLYDDTLVIDYLDGRQFEEIVGFEIVDIDGLSYEEIESDRIHMEDWVDEQLNRYQCSHVIDMWASGIRTICLEDDEGIVFEIKLETQKL